MNRSIEGKSGKTMEKSLQENAAVGTRLLLFNSCSGDVLGDSGEVRQTRGLRGRQGRDDATEADLGDRVRTWRGRRNAERQ